MNGAAGDFHSEQALLNHTASLRPATFQMHRANTQAPKGDRLSRLKPSNSTWGSRLPRISQTSWNKGRYFYLKNRLPALPTMSGEFPQPLLESGRLKACLKSQAVSLFKLKTELFPDKPTSDARRRFSPREKVNISAWHRESSLGTHSR